MLKFRHVLAIFLASLVGGEAKADYVGSWGLSGDISYAYGYSESAGGQYEMSLISTSLSTGGSIWQPWFATGAVSGTLGVMETASNQGGYSESQVLSTNVSLNVFPLSRFPFTANYSVQNGQVDSISQNSAYITSTQTTNKRLTLRQSYSTGRGMNSSVAYTRNISETVEGDTKSESYTMVWSRRSEVNSVDINGNYAISDIGVHGGQISNSLLTLDHSHTPDAEFGLNNLLGYTETKTQAGADMKSSVSQAASYFSWRPSYRPLFVGGGFRLAESSFDTGTANEQAAVSRGTSASLSLGYQFSRGLHSSLTSNVSVNDSDDMRVLTNSQSASLGYSSNQHILAGFSFVWNAGINGGASESKIEYGSGDDEVSSSNNAGGNVGYSLSRGWATGGKSNLNFSWGQGAGVSKSSDSENSSKSLSSNASMSWGHTSMIGQTFAQATASESRSYGDVNLTYQLINAQLSRNQSVTSLSNLSANLSYQASRQLYDVSGSGASSDAVGEQATSSDTSGSTPFSRSMSASVSFNHGRVFGLYGLRYGTTYTVSTYGTAETTSQSEWNNNLIYTIGRLNASLNYSTMKVENSPRSFSTFFRVSRSF